MTHPLYVAFIWHQHQPLYKSRITGRYNMPWVRLHGTKDYLDLILLLEKYPKLHQTVNLVPSLIMQLEDYAQGSAIDPYLTVTLTPTEQLTADQKRFIIDSFFDAQHHTLIAPHPRYDELYQQCQQEGKVWCLEHWSDRDFGDLLAWHNLAWIDPLFWEDPDVAAWLEQGQDFTLGDRQRIIAKHREIIQRILPQHRKMQETGQLEVTTTPYTHPILPLLADTDAGQVAVPHMKLPDQRFQWAEDIPRHLRKAWDLYCDRFGCKPRGLWPSEQSVSPAMLPYVAQQGFQWLCSDEAVLGWTLQHFFHRDGFGNVIEPELLYQPYRLETPTGDLSIVFRDHRLSDLVGFSYSGMDPQAAASDLVGHLESIAHRLQQRQSADSPSEEAAAARSETSPPGIALDQPWLVTIALDGENCWEFYQRDGIPFLENLYQQLSDHEGIRLVTVSEYLDQSPPREVLPADRLHSGSWVDGSFTTWIGDPVKNRAWDLLGQARQVLAHHPEATEEQNPDAWEALYAAEGSDWFWWFGEGHSSNHDAMFDQLFREHLIALYKALQEDIPEALHHPLERHDRAENMRPQSFIHPVITGIADEQDWDHAGRVTVAGARGTMHRSGPIQRLWYGLDHLNFYFRFDFQAGIQPGNGDPNEVHLFWYYSDQMGYTSPINLSKVPNTAPVNYRFRHHAGFYLPTQQTWLEEAGEYGQWHGRSQQIQLGFQDCLEVAIPWSDLEVEPDWHVNVLAVLGHNGEFVEHLPEDALIPFNVP
ncbi:glycoside hydrolase [Lyngbya confervoides]|uniref:Glycoside hydrolase n=1 Tax=Lyngbya confervoides BDU141951 TaxID=1574623 RepID=A0ABD4T0S2_9CYAN|nr:glycoside hydrolase [Lyngbya confervoides]MCM1981912.1 glycoside hydrolase [Lyngbya confervoides BDU141951]